MKIPDLLYIYRYIEGKSVRFFRCLDLANALIDAHRQGTSGRFMAALKKLDLIIVDELGFLPLRREVAELLKL
ncbi:ATP-binding protein [Thermoanaerobacterium sp. DL9XJH110]|uniref:ATP-binding protein n=1 Tax=Thermoanaerobacterium sp. DL9XJH110 TaxID=3386643 RepID=UPI003BB5AE0E